MNNDIRCLHFSLVKQRLQSVAMLLFYDWSRMIWFSELNDTEINADLPKGDDETHKKLINSKLSII
mgnify:FL=1